MNVLNINVNLYKSFLAAYKHRCISRAAEELLSTSSNIHQSLRELENQLNSQRLFIRQSRGVEPTSDAIALYPKIETAFNLIVEASQSIQIFDENSEVVIRMSVPQTLLSRYFKEYIKAFCKKYPRVRIELYGKEGIELLGRNKIDFAIEIENCFKQYSFKLLDVFTFSGVFVATQKYLTENKISKITKDNLCSIPIISRRETWSDLLKVIDIQREPFISVSSTEFAYSMAKDSTAVAYVYGLPKELNDNGTVCLHVEGIDLPSVKFVCAYNELYLTKPAKIFIEGLIHFCKQLTIAD